MQEDNKAPESEINNVANAENKTSGKDRLTLSQKINISLGTIFVISSFMLIFFGSKMNVFWAKTVFCTLFFSFSAWFFTSHKVYGKIIDRNRKKYRILDYISRICTTILPLSFLFLAVIQDIEDFEENCRALKITIIMIGIMIFVICQYLEVCFMLYDAWQRKKEKCGNQEQP